MTRALAALLCLWLALPAFAQDVPDYEEWERVAVRAENAVATARASERAFETLRAEVDGWRAEFLAAQDTNAARLETLRTQIEALGPAPEGEAAEADGLAERRAALNDQIAELAAPGIRASEAFSRADGIIGEIDAILRERRAAALLSRGPTPFAPSHWVGLTEEFVVVYHEFGAGFDRVRLSGSAQQTLGDNAPLIVILLVVAFVFVLRGRIWLERVGQRIEAEGTGAGLHLSGFLVSLGQVIVPMIGLVALTRALILTGLFEFYGQELVAYIPAFGLSFFIALWLAGRLFPSAEGVMTPLAVPQAKRPGARFVLLAIGITLALFGILQGLSAVGNFNLESLAALSFPFFAIMGYWLYRMGRVLGSHVPKTGPEGEPAPSVSDRVVALLSRFSKIVGVAAPLLAALGYLNAATALLVPALQSLALFAVLGLLIAACRDAYVLLSRGRGADESLIPVIIAIALFLASVPILALIWGATVNDLREILVRVQAGITIGETTISPSSFLVLVLVFAAGYFVTRFVQSALRTSILPKTKLDIGGQTAVTSGLGYLGIFIAALLAISAAGIDLTSLAFIGATLGVGIGFGLQNIVSNFISGIILLVERPISEGDWIEVGGNMGFVRDISVRSTRIETFDRTDVIIPNADLISGTVTNYTRGNTVGRVIVPVGVAYGTDTRRVEKILLEIAQAHPMVSLNPPPTVYFKGFGESSLDFEIRAILRDVIWVIVVHTELNHAIAERFAEEGIEIPFAQRDIWLRNPEALRPKGPKDLSE